MRKVLICGAAAVLATAAMPASAAELVFNLTGNTSVWNASKVGDPMIFTATDGTTTVQVQATAWSATKNKYGSGYSIAEAYLGAYSHGLGVTATGDNKGKNNEHTIDNHGTVDFIVLQFDQMVDVSTAKLTPFSVNGSTDNDSTIGFGTTSAVWNSDLNLTSSADLPWLFQDGTDINNSNKNKTLFDLVAGDATGNILIVAASFSNSDKKSDGFKLSSLTINTVPPAVPEPATWAMMIGGFGLIGAALRRARPVVKASIA